MVPYERLITQPHLYWSYVLSTDDERMLFTLLSQAELQIRGWNKQYMQNSMGLPEDDYKQFRLYLRRILDSQTIPFDEWQNATIVCAGCSIWGDRRDEWFE